MLVALRRCAVAARAARRPAPHAVARIARSAAGCARRSRSCGGPRTCGSSPRRRSTRSGPRWRSSTRRCSRVVPRLYRALDAALDPPPGRAAGPGRRHRPDRHAAAAGRARSCAGASGSAATATATRPSPPRSRSGRSGSTPTTSCAATRRSRPRLMQTVAAAVAGGPRRAAARVAPRPRRRGPARDRSPAPPPLPGRAVPPALRVHRRAAAPDARVPDRRAGAADRPLRARPTELDAELAEIQEALVADGLGRVAWGEVAELRWQLATFGFHLASLEVRQHTAVHARGARGDPARGAAERDRGRAGRHRSARSLATFRAIAAVQARFGADACRPLRRQLHGVGRRRRRRPRAGPARAGSAATAERSPASTSCRCSRTRRRSRPPGRSSTRSSLDDRATALTSGAAAIARR